MNYSKNDIYYCNNNRNLELSNRIYERNIPSNQIKPSINVRPSSTKYSVC